MSTILSQTDDQLRAAFAQLTCARDVAALLDVTYARLIYHIHKVPDQQKYSTFTVAKRAGGLRTICAPHSGIKIIQQKLNQVLQAVYEPRPCVHGFVRSRSVATNAQPHVGKRYVLNVDLSDFFPSIHFGRVRGLFMALPYECPAEVATVLAQICCFGGVLPQGAPTSPVVSNMVCSSLDGALTRLAKRHRCTYTRYADDLTFSTTVSRFPRGLAFLDQAGQVQIGHELQHIITVNSFKINPEKVHLQVLGQRHEVTGLVVDQKVNVKRQLVRQVRAMLHAWEMYDLPAAEDEYRARYDHKHRCQGKANVSYARVVRGKIEYIGMIRGKDDPIYRRFCRQLSDLAPDMVDARLLAPLAPRASGQRQVCIITEGVSDWKHLKAAYRHFQATQRYKDLEICFREDEGPAGSSERLAECKHVSCLQQSHPVVYIFDSDDKSIVKECKGYGQCYRDWGNNVYSMVLPTPSHRIDMGEVCIELYYEDKDIIKPDDRGRRLYLSSEFDPKTTRHISDTNLNCSDPKVKNKGRITIIDADVYDADSKSMAMSKNDFASLVLEGRSPFDNVDFSAFALVFDTLHLMTQG